jgi:hypothetical protein
MREISLFESRCVSGGFDFSYGDSGDYLGNVPDWVDELIVVARRQRGNAAWAVLSLVAAEALEWWKESEAAKRNLEEDAKLLSHQRWSDEIANRLAKQEDAHYRRSDDLIVYHFYNSGVTYYDDGADGSWDRKE